jgi:hypothetical protein
MTFNIKDGKVKQGLENLLSKLDSTIQETMIVFCKLKFLTFANIFPQAPVGNFFTTIYITLANIDIETGMKSFKGFL